MAIPCKKIKLIVHYNEDEPVEYCMNRKTINNLIKYYEGLEQYRKCQMLKQVLDDLEKELV
jgi:hypothetical protein